MTKTCVTCGTDFKVKPSKVGRFCSRRCLGVYQSVAWKGEGSAKWRPRLLRTCRLCGKEFRARVDEVERGRAVFCSPSCRSMETVTRRPATAPEKRMAAKLDALGIRYEMQKPFPGIGVVDFFIPEQSLVIEVDEAFWHSKPENHARDVRKDDALNAHGIAVIRLRASEV